MGLDEIYHICVDQYVKMPPPRKCRWGHVPPLPPRRYATDPGGLLVVARSINLSPIGQVVTCFPISTTS